MTVKLVIRCDACGKEHHSPYQTKITRENEREWRNNNDILGLCYSTTEPEKFVTVCNEKPCVDKLKEILFADLDLQITFDVPLPHEEEVVSLVLNESLEYPKHKAKRVSAEKAKLIIERAERFAENNPEIYDMLMDSMGMKLNKETFPEEEKC